MPPPLPPTTRYADRKAGLIVFGILTALMGFLCALLVPLMIVSSSMAPQGSPGTTSHTLLPATIMYGGLAVIFIWLGIGSIMTRRWARALLLVLNASWLAMGVFAMGMMIFLLPKITAGLATAPHAPGQPAPSPEMAAAIKTFMLGMMAVIYIIIPGVWVLFYRSRHVKATCEALDPVERWTDRTPLPVLAICLWLPFSSAIMIMLGLAYNGVLPFFGNFISGPVGAGVCLLVALIFAYATWAMYHLRWSGWWSVMICMGFFVISAFFTYSRHSIDELYALAGYSEKELDQIRQFNLFDGKSLSWVTLLSMVPFGGYLLYLRRYFPSGRENDHQTIG